MKLTASCVVLVIGFVIACACGAHANDSLAIVAAGGLKFTQTDELQMAREDLYLSPWEVRVAYVFRNLTNHDVTSTVAFPLPDIDVAASEAAHVYYRSANDGDIFDFHVEVDGRPIAPIFDAHAYHGQQDVTELLRKHHLTLLDEVPRPPLGKDAITELTAAGALLDDDDHHPNWIVKAAYRWEQVFPAGRDIRITHYYRPLLGRFYMGLMDITAPYKINNTYCPDAAFARALSKLPPRPIIGDEPPMWDSTELEYILSTGANWAGPIGHLRLELDKANSDLVSLCPIPGLHLVPKGRSFVADAEQYTPTTDIKVMFVYRGGRTVVPPDRRGVVLHPFTKDRP